MFLRSEFTDIQQSVYDALEILLKPLKIRRIGTVKATLYGEDKYKTYAPDINIVGVVKENPDGKLLTKYGLEDAMDIAVTIPKYYLDSNSIKVYDTDTLIYNDSTYVIKKIATDGDFPIADDKTGALAGTDILSLVVFARSECPETHL